MKPSSIKEAIAQSNKPAIVAFLTAGYPSKETFLDFLVKASRVVDVIEIGVPFTDPLADGLTIQKASHQALANGVNVQWIISEVGRLNKAIECPIALMSYLNPLLAYGFDNLANDAKKAGITGFIVPDLPVEESEVLGSLLKKNNIDLIQLVSPATPDKRLRRLCKNSSGFVYAVTKTGVTGGNGGMHENVVEYLKKVKTYANAPVCAGFGIRNKDQINELSPHVDGVILGSALIDAINQNEDVIAFLKSLKND
jgi:tryptophan synthase alpha chain